MAAAPALAAPVSWTAWSAIVPGTPTGGLGVGTITGFANTANVTYLGEVLPASYTGFGPPPPNVFPSWTPTSTFSGGSVGNAPTNLGSIALSGGPTTGVNIITFSPAVTDPVLAVWSLGSANTNSADFVFTPSEPFTIEAGGPSTETGGSSIIIDPSNSDAVLGVEGNGVVQFHGTFSSISWTNPAFENDYAFTVGSEGVVPEPASISLLGLVAMGMLKRRRVG
ncbi:MAG TPA: PEP-CTERM sorting domain-containing protein [Tepidisphaeraceae bacterium]|jgi:hypothetical protein